MSLYPARHPSARLGLAPVILAAVAACAVAAEPAAVPFPMDWPQWQQGGLDLSRFLDAPAGKHGHVVVKDGHFADASGRRLRFWGVNAAIDTCFPEPEKAPELAADLARLGVNLVRFHHLDTDWGRSLIDASRDDTRHLDAGNLDRFDRIFAECKQRGIHAVLTLNVVRKFKPGDGVRDHEVLGIGKAATYFNPRLIELQHEFARQLLTHVNPYTGLSYAKEPAIVGIELLNENSLIDAWCEARLRHGHTEKKGLWDPIPDSYATELDELYYDWLVKHATEAQRAAVAREANVSFDARPTPVPHWIRLTPGEFSKADRDRFRAEASFLVSLEGDFFRRFRTLIREELGCPALLTLTNDHADSKSSYATLRTTLAYGDWIDGHGYWQHPNIGATTRTDNTPAVNAPLDCPFAQFARSPAVGRPFTIGEVNHAFPHRYAAEGYPLLAAYAMLQDWDGIAWFDWEKGRTQKTEEGVRINGWFDLSNDPVKIAQLATCGLMWHRGDVRPAASTHVRTYSQEELRETLRLKDERPFFKPGFDLTTPLRQGTRFTLDAEAASGPTGRNGAPSKPWERPASIVSDTGELSWSHADMGQGVVKIDTPRACGLVGFVKANAWRATAQTRHFVARSLENDHVSLLLVSLDDAAIANSRRLLLTAVCRSANTGQAWRDDLQTLAAWGRGPITIVPVAGKLALCGLADAKVVRATPWTSAAVPQTAAVPLTRTEDAWELSLDVPTVWWEITLE
jgi:hypothetical protein